MFLPKRIVMNLFFYFSHHCYLNDTEVFSLDYGRLKKKLNISSLNENGWGPGPRIAVCCDSEHEINDKSSHFKYD